MNNTYRGYNFFHLIRPAVLFMLVLGTSCTREVYLRVLQPAPVNVGEHIQTIALVNRTKPQNVRANVVEGILTGEGMYEDKSGVENAFMGLNTVLRNSPRFQVKQTNVYLTGSGTGVTFPTPLDWDQVRQLCADYQVDAICAAETYDTDTQIVPGVRIVNKTRQDGSSYKQTEFTASLGAQVNIGFRFYDPRNRTIRDEYRFSERLQWNGSGLTPDAAIAALINKKAATDRVSYVLGERYASRISPSWTRVSREYYKKGSREMKQAFRMASVNDWEGAARIWESIVGTTGRKTSGKAAYNRALAAEVLGNLDEAKAWSVKAYTLYNNRKARYYSNVLDNRIYNSQRLDNQMRTADGN